MVSAAIHCGYLVLGNLFLSAPQSCCFRHALPVPLLLLFLLRRLGGRILVVALYTPAIFVK